MIKPQDVVEPGQSWLVARLEKSPAIDVAVPPKEISTSLQERLVKLKLDGKTKVKVSDALFPLLPLQPVVSRLLLMVKAIVWFDVADGWELDNISLRETT